MLGGDEGIHVQTLRYDSAAGAEQRREAVLSISRRVAEAGVQGWGLGRRGMVSGRRLSLQGSRVPTFTHTHRETHHTDTYRIGIKLRHESHKAGVLTSMEVASSAAGLAQFVRGRHEGVLGTA